jgi:methylated-DNA-protein-cysteine methyltransferase-like protein
MSMCKILYSYPTQQLGTTVCSKTISMKDDGTHLRGKSMPDIKTERVRRCIRSLPAGTVSSYGAIARAAGWARAARQVARILRATQGLPWHRVVGSGGAIKLGGENAAEQKFRLRMEGVTFRGARVDMKRHEFHFPNLKSGRSKKL